MDVGQILCDVSSAWYQAGRAGHSPKFDEMPDANEVAAVRIRELIDAAREEGRQVALEAAAKIAEDHGQYAGECGGGTECWANIAKQIRAKL